MKKVTGYMLSLLLFTLLLSGCNRPATDNAEHVDKTEQASEENKSAVTADNSKVLVKVNSMPITQQQYEIFVRILNNEVAIDQIGAEKKQQILDEMIERQLLQQYALDNGLETDLELAIALQQQRQLLLSLAAKKHILDNIEPLSDTEILARYELEKSRAHPNEYHIQLISVSTEEEAINIIEKLDAGDDFSTLAKEHSLGKAKENGGDLGWVGQTSTTPLVLDSLAAMQKGSWSKTPLQTSNGWQVMKLVDTRPVTFLDLQQARPRLKALLQRERLIAEIQSLRDGAKIELVGPEQQTPHADYSGTASQ